MRREHLSSVPVFCPCSGLEGAFCVHPVTSWAQVSELHSSFGSMGQQKAQVLPRAVADIPNQMSSIKQHRMNGVTPSLWWVRQEMSPTASQSALLVLSSILAKKPQKPDGLKLVETCPHRDEGRCHNPHRNSQSCSSHD